MLKILFVKIPHQCLVDPYRHLITFTTFTHCEAPSFDKILFATPLLHQTRRPRQSRSRCPPPHRVPLGPLPACPILLLHPRHAASHVGVVGWLRTSCLMATQVTGPTRYSVKSRERDRHLVSATLRNRKAAYVRHRLLAIARLGLQAIS